VPCLAFCFAFSGPGGPVPDYLRVLHLFQTDTTSENIPNLLPKGGFTIAFFSFSSSKREITKVLSVLKFLGN
jgi:hypothetical protein